MKYTLPDPSEVRYQASKHLDDRRGEMMIRLFMKHSKHPSKKRSKKGKNIPSSIPMPGERIDKPVNVAGVRRRALKHKPSPLCFQAGMNEAGLNEFESSIIADIEEIFEGEEDEADEVETRKPKAALLTSAEEMDEYWNRLNDIHSGKILKDSSYVFEVNKRWEAAMTQTEDLKKTAKSGQEKAVTFAAPVVTGLRYYDAEEDESEEVESDAASFVNKFRYHNPEEYESEEYEFEEDESGIDESQEYEFEEYDPDEDEFEEDESGMGAPEFAIEDPDEHESKEDESGMGATEFTIEDPDEDECEEDESGMGASDFAIEDPDDIDLDDEEFEDIFVGEPGTLYLPVSLPVSGEKRKRESEISPASTELYDIEHREKRRKLKTVSSFSRVPKARKQNNSTW